MVKECYLWVMGLLTMENFIKTKSKVKEFFSGPINAIITVVGRIITCTVKGVWFGLMVDLMKVGIISSNI